MTKAVWILTLALIAGATPAIFQVAAQPSPAKPWWPDPDATQDDIHDGWNLRIPLRLQNPGDMTLQAGYPVQVHIDLGQAMMQGGWPGSTNPRSFRADPESVRLIEYTPSWTAPTREVPFKIFHTWLDPNQQAAWGKVQSGSFHPTLQPFITLEWRLGADLPTSGLASTAYYYLYFEIEQNYRSPDDRKGPAPLERLDEESLDALYWIGRGTVIFGDHPGSANQAPTLQVVATEDDTTVSVLTYRGLSLPQLDFQPGQTNPFQLASAGDRMRYSFGPDPTQFMVTADRPVIVLSHRGSAGSGDFVPSLDGGLRGSQFVVPALGQSILVTPAGDGTATVCVTERGASGTCRQVHLGSTNRLFQLSTDEQMAQANNVARLFDVTADTDVLLQYVPARRTFVQAPSTYGSPVGHDFIASTIASTRGGFLVSSWSEAATAEIRDPVNDRLSTLQLDEPHAPQHAVGANYHFLCPTCPHTWPLAVTSKSPDSPASKGSPIQVLAGEYDAAGNPQFSTPWGGRHALEFDVHGAFLVHAFYGNTEFSLSGENALRQLDEGNALEIQRDPTTVTHLTSNKPLSVLPTQPPEGFVRFHAAKPGFLTPQVLPGEYRGYLIDVKPKGASDPVFINALPGQEVKIDFEVTNLGLWNGATLPDQVSLTLAATPTDWGGSASFDQSSMALDTSTPFGNALRVSLPDEVPPNSAVSFIVQATSQGNENMQGSFNVVVFTRQTFGVDAWFGEPGSLSGETARFPRVQQGIEESFPFVVRNTGTGTDSFVLTVNSPGGGWEARIRDATGTELAEMPSVAPGAVRTGSLVVRAPLSDSLTAAVVTMDVTSKASPLAAARLLLDARLDLGQGIELSADPARQTVAPGSTGLFTITAINTGQDAIALRASLQGLVPEGWTARLTGLGAEGQTPSLFPGQTTEFGAVVTVPLDAPAGQLLSLLVRADGLGEGVTAGGVVGLHTEVGRQGRLVATLQDTVDARPGTLLEMTASIQNQGNGIEQLLVVPKSLPPGWTLRPPPVPVMLAPAQNATLNFTLRVSEGFPAGLHEVQLQIVSTMGSIAPVPFQVRVLEDDRLEWAPVSVLQMHPGQSEHILLVLTNSGNTPRNVRIEPEGPLGWTLHVAPASAPLAPGDSLVVNLHLAPSPDAPADSVTLAVHAQDDIRRSSLELSVNVTKPTLLLRDVKVVAASARAAVGYVVASFHNPGSVPMDAIVVQLRDQEETLDEVTFASVGPNGTVIAPLRWVANEGNQPDRLLWGRLVGQTMTEVQEHTLTEVGSVRGSAQTTPTVSLLTAAVVLAATRLSWRVRT